jgi:hypothetical protein
MVDFRDPFPCKSAYTPLSCLHGGLSETEYPSSCRVRPRSYASLYGLMTGLVQGVDSTRALPQAHQEAQLTALSHAK